MQAPTQTYTQQFFFCGFSEDTATFSFHSVFVSGELSPQIEECMLQYVFLFRLLFVHFFFRNEIEKMAVLLVLMCSPAL